MVTELFHADTELFHAAPKIWNSMRVSLRTCCELSAFKSNIKTLLFKRAFQLQFHVYYYYYSFIHLLFFVYLVYFLFFHNFKSL